MIFNASMAILGAVSTALLWNDPAHQFGCGMNFMVALWCFIDFLKEAARQ